MYIPTMLFLMSSPCSSRANISVRKVDKYFKHYNKKGNSYLLILKNVPHITSFIALDIHDFATM